ncbi:MAG: xylose isomerase domain-containing [Prolixibacteraceae bacterium]|nr:MAG: xylose isomerase domain-containing [Prolixibacteraceae bacterium]
MFRIILLTGLLAGAVSCEKKPPKELDMKNYFAWCIVPFDNQNRTPEQRIEMLKRLGFVSYAYDWREKHLPEMAKEINLAAENGIKMNAVWMWIDKTDSIGQLSPNNQKVLQALAVTGLKTQIWVSFPEDYFDEMGEDERLDRSREAISYLSGEADKLGCKIGLYNHGGWFGNPNNLVEIIEMLPEKEIGIIFNFHHAHDLLANYEEMVKNMTPHLWAVNLNGMNPDGPKILPVGSGEKEAEMISILKDNGFTGPFGIMGHVEDADVELVLQENLEGLKKLMGTKN